VEDLAPGVELGMVIEREEKLVLTDVLEILHQTAKGLEAIHFAGYLMRDLTPSQILVWRAESGLGVRIVDLGLARSIGHGSDLTDPEVVAGTPGYLAPELVYGINPTIAADVYSLAVVAFHLFSGQLPHHGIKGAATVAMQLAMEPPRLVPLLPLSKRCCRALDELFSRALDSDPTRRPSSPLHFVRELTDCCNRFSTSWWRRWFA
jgi:serine/threonine-protein kinase